MPGNWEKHIWGKDHSHEAPGKRARRTTETVKAHRKPLEGGLKLHSTLKSPLSAKTTRMPRVIIAEAGKERLSWNLVR